MTKADDAIVIVAAKRTPIGNFNGVFTHHSAAELGATAIQGVLEQAAIEPAQIDEVLMGCVLPAGQGQAPARQAALAAGLPMSTGATTVNKMCGSGMKTVMQAVDSLCANSADIIIAGGMENMSAAPYLLPKARFGYRLGHSEIIDHMMKDGLEDAYTQGQSMGCFAEQCAQKFHFTRKQQDAFALMSLQRAYEASEQGLFKAEIAPFHAQDRKGQTTVIDKDQGPYSVKAEKIPQLRPAFAADGSVTAANSSSISDGAAALLLMRASQANQLKLPILATICGHATHAQAPAEFTTAPIKAIDKLLKKCQWSLDQVDLFEINEAFAVVTMAAMQTLKIPAEKVNIHGGACTLGHPIGASGARILVTLLYAMRSHQLKRGVAALCIGGGEATAIALECHDTNLAR